MPQGLPLRGGTGKEQLDLHSRKAIESPVIVVCCFSDVILSLHDLIGLLLFAFASELNIKVEKTNLLTRITGCPAFSTCSFCATIEQSNSVFAFTNFRKKGIVRNA